MRACSGAEALGCRVSGQAIANRSGLLRVDQGVRVAHSGTCARLWRGRISPDASPDDPRVGVKYRILY